MNKIDEILLNFEPINLTQLEQVSLMKRVDTKFISSSSKLPSILNELSVFYKILTIENCRIFPYKTEYFDTPAYNMYVAHQNGKLNRYKVRKREYLKMRQHFLEVKFKNNKGKTIKNRVERCSNMDTFSLKEKSFLEDFSPYKAHDLELKLKNQFNRITLAGKNERITIDFSLEFWDHSNYHLAIPEVCIIEVKQNKYNSSSTINSILKKQNIRAQSFSKYCFGAAALNKNIKANMLKPKFNMIEKIKTRTY